MKGPGWIESRRGHPEASHWTPQPPTVEQVEQRGGFVYAWCELVGGEGEHDTKVCMFVIEKRGGRREVFAHDCEGTVWGARAIKGCIWPLVPPEAVRPKKP